MGKSVSGKNFDARYAPGILTRMIEDTLLMKGSIDFPRAQKYPQHEKWIPANTQSNTYERMYWTPSRITSALS